MLHLKRTGRFNELLKCKVSGEFIGPTDYYYEDDEDGLIIKATVYERLKQKRIEETFDYSRLNFLQDLKSYEEALKETERQFLAGDVLERKIFGKDVR